MTRLADALGFSVPGPEAFEAGGLDGALAGLIRGASTPTMSLLTVVMRPRRCHAKKAEQG